MRVHPIQGSHHNVPVINDLAPSFITYLLDLDLRRKSLRSDTQGMHPIPYCSLSQVRNSSIRYAGPRPHQELKNIKGFQNQSQDLAFCQILWLELNYRMCN